jgi:hypothetical protein
MNNLVKENYIKRDLITICIATLISILFPLVAVLIPFHPSHDTQAQWFARSGSIATVLLIMSQARLSNVMSILTPRAFFAPEGIVPLRKKYLRFSLNLQKLWGCRR